MLRNKPFLRIILLFSITLTGLLLVYPLIRNTYLDVLVNTGNRFFSHPGKEASVKFLDDKKNKDLDLVMHVGNSFRMETEPNTTYLMITRANTYYLSWIPLALMIALILASPVRLLKKGIVLIAGVFLVHVIAYLKLFIQIYYVSNQHRDLGIFLLSPSWMKADRILLDHFTDTLQPSLILIIIIWLLITFTYKDYKKLMGLAGLESNAIFKAKSK